MSGQCGGGQRSLSLACRVVAGAGNCGVVWPSGGCQGHLFIFVLHNTLQDVKQLGLFHQDITFYALMCRDATRCLY